MHKTYLYVSYDIADPALERQVVKTLKRYGMRYQYSIFICHLTEKMRKSLTDEFKKIYNQRGEDETFRIAIFPVCAMCLEGRTEIGEPVNAIEGDIVV